jgi:hypothetical protein
LDEPDSTIKSDLKLTRAYNSGKMNQLVTIARKYETLLKMGKLRKCANVIKNCEGTVLHKSTESIEAVSPLGLYNRM